MSLGARKTWGAVYGIDVSGEESPDEILEEDRPEKGVYSGSITAYRPYAGITPGFGRFSGKEKFGRITLELPEDDG